MNTPCVGLCGKSSPGPGKNNLFHVRDGGGSLAEAKQGESKAVIVLRALLQGHDVAWHNKVMSIIRDAGGHACIVVRGQKLDLSSGQSREIYIGLDLTLAGFISWCEKLADEDVFILAADCALTDLHREGGFK